MKEYGYNTGLGAVLSTAPFSATGMGGQMTHSYNYDGLYRLVNATGNYTGASGKTASYSLDMQYDNLHNITSKKQHVQQSNIVFDGTLKAGYDLSYSYDKPFQISTLQDENYRTEGDVEKDKITNEHAYKYDANGNLIYINTSREKQDGTKEAGSGEKKYLWDEENRLLSANTNGFISSYWYDASGERVIKASGDDEGIYVNGLFSGARTETSNFTAYINPYLVVSKGGNYTKHIYIGSQRIVSKLGDLDSYGQDPRRIPYAGADVEGADVDYAGKYKESQQTIKDRYGDFEVPYYGKDNDDYVNGGGFCCDDNPKLRAGAIGNGNDNPEVFQYYYHSDHLGSTSLITDLDGDIVQHVEYVPFGEVFIEERNNKWNTPYLFNAKELDEETGLYYYGARYLDSRTSQFLGVDPLTEKYPGISAFAYCLNNPMRYVDPTGEEAWEATRDWDEDDFNQFQEFAASRLKEYKGKSINCADLALTLLIDYASENGLALNLTNKAGKTFDSNSDNYNTVDEYKYGYKEEGKKGLQGGVLPGIQARDIPSNTFSVDTKDAAVGDMKVITSPWEHVVIYNSIPRDADGKEVGNRKITYGNYDSTAKKDLPVKWNQFDFTYHNPTHYWENGVKKDITLTYDPSYDKVRRWNIFKPNN